jgi:hypothetical protein
MDLKGKVALFQSGKTTVDIVDAVTGEVVQQHDVEGTIGGSAFVRKNVAAIVVQEPYYGVHVMDIKSGKVYCKYLLLNREDVNVTLSEDALTLAVGTSSGVI